MNERLEQRVRERTHELVESNARLQEEIKERKRAERDLLKALTVAELANRAKSEFLATMSHEIRTPMNGILGISELAMMGELSDRQRDYFNDIKTSAEALLTVINDILDYSKIESGNLTVENIEMNLYQTVEAAVNVIAVKAFQKNIELLCEFEKGVGEFMMGDPYRVRQVIINLVSNAVKFTERGEIKVLVSAAREGAGSVLSISVSDTGIGIHQDKLGSIFEGFKQADSSITRQYGGSGLGLAISKHLALAMGGDLKVKSSPGKGSVFTLSLPASFVEHRRPARGRAKLSAIPEKILVVDDNAENIRIIKNIIASFSEAEVDGASNALEALEKLSSCAKIGKPFGAAIVDYKMPFIDGMALAEKIRGDEKIRGVSIIMMSAACDITPVLAQFQSAAGAYINKPVKRSELIKVLCAIEGRAAQEPVSPLQSADRPAAEPPALPGTGKTLLIAEDNDINLKIIREMVKVTSGCEVLVARDGAEAVAIAGEKRVDMIFMDVQMPVLDGFEATRKIRAMQGANRTVPIVAITANALRGDREKCLQAGMNDYMSKPFTPLVVAEMIARYTSSGQAPAQGAPERRGNADTGSFRIDTESAFDYIGFLAAIGGEKAIFKEVIDTFGESFAASIDKIERLIGEGRYDELKFAMHNLKGAAGNIFAFSIQKIARVMEEKLAAGDHEDLAGLAAELKKARDAFESAARDAFIRLMI